MQAATNGWVGGWVETRAPAVSGTLMPARVAIIAIEREDPLHAPEFFRKAGPHAASSRKREQQLGKGRTHELFQKRQHLNVNIPMVLLVAFLLYQDVDTREPLRLQ